jgi:hypothetical protein
LPLKQRQDALLLHQQHLGGFQRAGIGWVAFFRGQRHFGERLASAEDVNDLLLARRIYTVNIDGTALDDVKPAGRAALMEKV